jgi:ribosomal protein S18 acetylase RimI-like enzyme
MSYMVTTRLAAAGDLLHFKDIIDQSGLFPASLLDDMIAPWLAGGVDGQRWLAAEIDGVVVGLAYVAAEVMTDRVWNLYLIAVGKRFQRSGIGSRLVLAVEEYLRTTGQRLLLVETSGVPSFETVRAFYQRAGFSIEGRIRDYYQENDDMVIFSKRMADK